MPSLAYNQPVRPGSRRRPAGVPQVPSLQTPAPLLVARLQPTVVRLAVDRGVVDAPWGISLVAIAHVWPEGPGDPQWIRVAWPLDRSTRRFIAPVDLQIGHVLEIAAYREAPRYAWVADADQHRFVLAPAPRCNGGPWSRLGMQSTCGRQLRWPRSKAPGAPGSPTCVGYKTTPPRRANTMAGLRRPRLLGDV